MEKTTKVRCIDFFGITDYFTEGKIYDVVGEDGHDYIIVSDSGNRACWCKRWFEIVEEKPVEEIQDIVDSFMKANSITVPWTLAKAHNKIDRMNRDLCSGIKPVIVILKSQEDIERYFGYKKFKMTVLDEAGVFYPQSDTNWKSDNSNIIDDIDGACSIIKKTGQSIRYKWRFNAHSYNLIDKFNRMECEEKKFKGMHVPYLRDIVENIEEKPGLYVENMIYNLKDSHNRKLCQHIETPPEKKVEYHEPGFKSKWDTVGI